MLPAPTAPEEKTAPDEPDDDSSDARGGILDDPDNPDGDGDGDADPAGLAGERERGILVPQINCFAGNRKDLVLTVSNTRSGDCTHGD